MALYKVSQVTKADHALVTAAVAEAECRTSGEIVTIITDLSDHYEDISLAWASAAAFIALCVYAIFPDFYLGIVNWISGGWHHKYSVSEYLGLLSAAIALKWFGTWLVMQWMPLRLVLTPKYIKLARVRQRAVSLFKVGAESKTVGRTGVLLYLSLKEHRAEIVVDEGIAGKVSPEIWGDAMVAMIERVKIGQPGEGMAEAVRQMGKVLAEHFPKGSENPNELPDRLIEL
jgi:putative membrane protein